MSVSVCTVQVLEGPRGPGLRKPGDAAQMMSEFGRDPNAGLMDSTRGLSDSASEGAEGCYFVTHSSAF